MILRYVARAVFFWLIARVFGRFGRFLPALRRGRRFFSL